MFQRFGHCKSLGHFATMWNVPNYEFTFETSQTLGRLKSNVFSNRRDLWGLRPCDLTCHIAFIAFHSIIHCLYVLSGLSIHVHDSMAKFQGPLVYWLGAVVDWLIHLIAGHWHLVPRTDRKSQVRKCLGFVQLIFGPCWLMNQLNKNQNTA